MTGFQLKLLALFTMLVDHMGAVLFPQVLLFRLIGRISFPVYCFLLSEGLVHTSNRRRYLERLLLFSLISEVPFDLVFYHTPFYFGAQNVFFTLAAGLAAGWIVLQNRQRPAFTFLGVGALMVAAELFQTDYGWFGVALIVLFVCFRGKRTFLAFSISLLVCLFVVTGYWIELFALLALFPIFLYNEKRGRSLRLLFYVFYPAHLLLLFFIWLAVHPTAVVLIG